jgi:hypothetical protein
MLNAEALLALIFIVAGLIALQMIHAARARQVVEVAVLP